MSIKKETKDQLKTQFGNKEGDTGSVEVQCAVLSERIKNLTEHLKKHSKDFSSRRGLLILVSRRRKLLDYLSNKNEVRYEALIKKLNLKPKK